MRGEPRKGIESSLIGSRERGGKVDMAVWGSQVSNIASMSGGHWRGALNGTIGRVEAGDRTRPGEGVDKIKVE